VLAAPCDVCDAPAVAAFRDAVEARFGATDILVNNAGQGRRSNFATTSDEDWRAELDLKYFSLIRPIRTFLPLLARSDAGAVLCVNALLAQEPEPHMVATASARAGVLSLAKSLSRELAGDGIRVNSILVGLIESGQWRRRFDERAAEGESWQDWTAALAAARDIPLGRIGRPEEAAAAIVFLVSPLAGYITGATLEVSGGQARHV
jgi:NAD(P)-dependent dehydrogenase (short-subunit alcohol dehydrogenase family)